MSRTMVLMVTGTERPIYDRESINTRRAIPAGLHPVTATRPLTIRQILRKDFAWTVEHWDSLTDEYKTWWVRQCRRLGVK